MTAAPRSVRVDGVGAQYAILKIMPRETTVDFEWHHEVVPANQGRYAEAFAAGATLLVDLWNVHRQTGANGGELEPGSPGAWHECPNELAGAAERALHAAMTSGLASVDSRAADGR